MKSWMGCGMAVAVLSLAVGLGAGCEDGNDGGGGGGDNAFVGTWRVTKHDASGATVSYYVFNADGTFRKNLAAEPVDGQVHLQGTYTVDGGALHGDFTNPGVGTGEIVATINADGTMTMDFIEHWHTPYKHVPSTGVAQ